MVYIWTLAWTVTAHPFFIFSLLTCHFQQIVVSLLNKRPSANSFFNSSVLQEFTRATNVRLRLLRTKTLLGHLMSVERRDPTVTRRVSNMYLFYLILHMPVYSVLQRLTSPPALLKKLIHRPQKSSIPSKLKLEICS